MFINEKIVNLDKIKKVLEGINRKKDELDDEKMALTNIYIWCHDLTYDELIYLQQHSDLIISEYNKRELNIMVDRWNNIIKKIEISLLNGTIDNYLSTIDVLTVADMISCFGFNNSGVTLTENGEILFSSLKKQIDIINTREGVKRVYNDLFAQQKGFDSFRDYLLTESLERKPENSEMTNNKKRK